MAAVTQLVQNFLGGVSTQVDNKKLPGQVREATNAYPDPTFGMLKRNGMRFIRTIDNASGVPFTEAELKDAAWFPIQRGPREAFFGAIKGSNIYVWNAVTGELCTVDNQGSSYLTGTSPSDYSFRTIQDVTVVTNRFVAPQMNPKPSWTRRLEGTVVLKIVEYSSNYSVSINGSSVQYTTRNSSADNDDGSNVRLNAGEILNGLASLIQSSFGGISVTVYPTSLELKSSSQFTLAAVGGINNRALESFQDTINDIADLPVESAPERIVEVLNAGGAQDNYWLRYVSGIKTWKERRDPTTSDGFVASTMPHELQFTSENTLQFAPIPWTIRKAGNDITNPPPSIFPYNDITGEYETTGTPINATFFYSNRFGLLCGDNVILSQSNDPYNLFARSAIVQTDADPIDINCASVAPVELFNVLPDSQGLLLFSKRQQFLMFAAQSGVMTPSSTIIRSVSNYEMDETIAPVDVGTSVNFVSKVPAYTRAFSLQTRGLEDPPIVLDLSKTAAEYIPESIDRLESSPQNSFIAMSARDENGIYMYRYYNNGEKDLFQAWVKWTMPGKVQIISILNDMMIVVTQQQGEYTLGLININDIPIGGVFNPMPERLASPVIDMVSRPTNVTYNSATNKTSFNVGFTPLDREAIMLLVPNLVSSVEVFETTFDLASFNYTGTKETDDDIGFWKTLENVDGGFELTGDWTQYTSNMLIGYNYEFSLDLPTFYYNMAEDGSVYDYTASLTINRVKVSSGKTGALTFKLKAKGSDEWVDVQSVTDASYYEADTSPVYGERRFTVPVNQRNTNFNMKITSSLPYPVSIVSMMWEGQYQPRFYKRS